METPTQLLVAGHKGMARGQEGARQRLPEPVARRGGSGPKACSTPADPARRCPAASPEEWLGVTQPGSASNSPRASTHRVLWDEGGGLERCLAGGLCALPGGDVRPVPACIAGPQREECQWGCRSCRWGCRSRRWGCRSPRWGCRSCRWDRSACTSAARTLPRRGSALATLWLLSTGCGAGGKGSSWGGSGPPNPPWGHCLCSHRSSCHRLPAGACWGVQAGTWGFNPAADLWDQLGGLSREWVRLPPSGRGAKLPSMRY